MGAVCCKDNQTDLLGEVELSHFYLLKSVGKGAFGKVRVVKHKSTKKIYALKYINKNKCIDMKAVGNIISERQHLERIHHSFIVNLRYAFQDDEYLFMVLDLMLGGDLRFHLERLGTLPESYVQFYAAELSLALNYLHSENIVHRDIKPDNVLLDDNGHVHLTDFNVANRFDDKKPRLLKSIAGSMAYIAPEVLQKEGYYYSVDWWSLGVLLYELLYGKRPFRAKSSQALQKAILSKPIEFPMSPKVSPEAVSFVKSLLDRDIKQRLGVGDLGFERLKKHPWLKDIDWDTLAFKTKSAPFVPDKTRSNFDPTHELEEVLLEERPLKARKRTANFKKKKDASNEEQIAESKEKGYSEKIKLEQKFLLYDYTRSEKVSPASQLPTDCINSFETELKNTDGLYSLINHRSSSILEKLTVAHVA